LKAVRVLAVADASALPGLRRALSPESIELVGVASTPGGVLAQMRRVSPDVVVVDLSLSQTDVFLLITQVVQEHAVVVLALAFGEDAGSLAERAHAAGASDVVERRTLAGSWHEESGSPHVLSLRVLSLAASARPRPSGLSLRVSRLPLRVSSPVPQLSAAGRAERGPGATPGVSREVRGSPLSAAGLAGRAPGSPSPLLAAGSSSRELMGSRRASSAAEPSPPGVPHSQSGSTRSVTAGVLSTRAPGSRAPDAEAPPSTARVSGLPRSRWPKTGQPLMAAQIELVAIGASTGGTLALAELLKTLPESAPPMLVVQHMLPEFTNDFAQRLNELCELQVRVAVDGDLVKPGTVLLAPGGRHLRVMRDAEQRLRARVTDELPVGKHRPSVDVLFQACAETLGSAALGVLLTGMGDDGARGLLALHNNGARTLVQDQASSVCFGMPSAAIALGAAQQILPLQDIAHALRELIKKRSSVRV
jgi:chemotaxis response regulator CheB